MPCSGMVAAKTPTTGIWACGRRFRASIAHLPRPLVAVLLGGPNGASFGSVLGKQFGETGTWALGSAMGVVLFAVSTMFFEIDWKRM